MADPLVSVHIIIYNMIDYIEETLTSALEQDYDNLEVIAADDGSTDGTAEVIADFAVRYRGRLVPLLGGPNLGHTGNSNRGLRACRGKYIAFQGGDDVLLPGKIKAQVAWLEESQDRVLCYHDYEAFNDENGERLYLASEFTRLVNGKGADYPVRVGCPWGAVTVMVRASAIPPHGFDPHIAIVSDWILWIDCLAKGGAYGFVDGVYARYRRHARNISKSGLQVLQDDQFATLALAESRYPHLLSAVRVGRARLLRTAGMTEMRRGNSVAARSYWWGSMMTALHWKAILAWGVTFLPRNTASRIVAFVKPPFLY
jgi:glycosyltransferase involved in cell wall biosynthesis